MWNIELYDRRYDWLVASLAAIPLVWMFYGFEAAFVSMLVFALVGALKPLVSRLGSRLAAGVFAAGMVLLLSPLLRFLFYTGYCFEGVWSPGAGISRYLVPDLCRHGFISNFGQGIWIGPLRDLAIPVAGIGLMVLAWLDPKQAALDTEDEAAIADGDEPAHRSCYRRLRLANWSVVFLAASLWVGGSYLNYRAEQEMLEQKRLAEISKRAQEAAAATEEARRVAAEKAARRVELKWLQGIWVAIDGLDSDVRKNKNLYCATDSGIKFEGGSHYNWYDEEGSYRLDDGEVSFTNRVRTEFANPDAIPENLEPSTRKVERNGKHLMIDGETYARC